MNIKKDLQEIFRDVFDEEELELTEGTSAKDIEDWDSFAQIQLVVAIEKHFDVRFHVDEVGTLKNVGEIIQLIEKRMKG